LTLLTIKIPKLERVCQQGFIFLIFINEHKVWFEAKKDTLKVKKAVTVIRSRNFRLDYLPEVVVQEKNLKGIILCRDWF